MSDQGNDTKADDVGEAKEGSINDPLTQTDAKVPQETWEGGSEE